METSEKIRKAKSEYRRKVYDRIAGLSEDYIREASAAIALNALNIKEMKDAKTVMAYCSVEREPGTLAVISRLLADGKKVCLPRCMDLDEEGRQRTDVDVKDAMEARYIRSFDDLEPRSYGIPEPKDHTEKADPGDIELIILPCVSCDRSCRRLGHGGGYYDKFLSMVRDDCFKMALCYEEILEDEIPVGTHDVPPDAVITEKTVDPWRP